VTRSGQGFGAAIERDGMARRKQSDKGISAHLDRSVWTAAMKVKNLDAWNLLPS